MKKEKSKIELRVDADPPELHVESDPLDLREDYQKTSGLILEPSKDSFWTKWALVGAAFISIPLCPFLLMGISCLPFGRVIIDKTPLWAAWILTTILVFLFGRLVRSNEKVKLDDQSLGCWMGNNWKLFPWTSIQLVEVIYEGDGRYRPLPQTMEITTHDGTFFTYRIASIAIECESYDIVEQLKRRLGDKVNQRGWI